MRSLNANQILAQESPARTPYIYMLFTSADGLTTYDFSFDGTYGNRVLLIDHTENPYSTPAFILFQNTTRDVPDLTGYWTEIGYGDTYGGSNYYGKTARGWGKKKQLVSTKGRGYTLLTLGGTWEVLSEQLCLYNAPFYTRNVYEGEAEYQTMFWGQQTVLGIMRSILAHLIINTDNYTGILGLSAITTVPTAPADGILDTYLPYFQIQRNQTVADILWRLIQMTMCVIRLRKTNDLTIVFPQETDAVDKIFYSYQHPYFYEYKHITNITTPNYVIVEGQADPALGWNEESNYVIGTAQLEQTQIDKYFKAQEIYFEPNLRNASDCEDRAIVILNRLQHQDVTGELEIPHDAALELYDKIEIVDSRGTT